MSLVGDLILELRRRIPDQPSALAAPTGLTLTPQNVAGGTIPNGTTVYVVATSVNQWGESLPTAEVSVTVNSPNNSILVSVDAVAGPTGIRAYYSTTPGAELQYVGSTSPVNQATIVGLIGIAGAVPTRSTAWLPDTDGTFVGAFAAFKLLNQALAEMVKIGGGITDLIGVQSISGQAMYRIPQSFFEMIGIWFDGYPMDIVPRRTMFLRNSVPGFSGLASFESDGQSQIVQVWPQSNRTGGQNTLSAPVSLTDTNINITSAVGFLSIGLALIDSEYIGYSTISGNQMQGCIRGIGGSVPATHASGATITELNLRMSGKRLAVPYNVGDAPISLAVPQGWETPIVLHMLAQVRSMEQDDASAEKLLAEFQVQAQLIAKQSRNGTKPRQIMINGGGGIETFNTHIGGGWIIQ